MTAGIEAMARKGITSVEATSGEEVIREYARKLLAAGKEIEQIRRDLARLTGRDHLSYQDVAELTGTAYKPPSLAQLHAYGCYEYFERGFGFATLARWWSEAGYPTRSGRGKWHAQTVEKFLNDPPPR